MEARAGFSGVREPTGWDNDYPSALQSLDRMLGTIPCDVTHNVKSFSMEKPDVFWDRSFSLFSCQVSPSRDT